MPPSPAVYTETCPRCKVSRLFTSVDGSAATFRCNGCEWAFLLQQQAPLGLTSDALAQGATALALTTPTTPTIPASGTPATNGNSYTILVTVSGGTMTANTQINGVSTGQTTGTFTVAPGSTITIFYSVAPTWALAAAGTQFTGGMLVLLDSGSSAEIVTASGGSTATSVPVSALSKAHGSGVLAGQLLFATAQPAVELVPGASPWPALQPGTS